MAWHSISCLSCWFESNKRCDLMSPSDPLDIEKRREKREKKVHWRQHKNQTGATPPDFSPALLHIPSESSHCLSTEPKPRLHAFREVSKHSCFLKGKTCCWWKLGATNPLRDNLWDRKNQGRSTRRSLPLQSRGFCWNKNSKCGCCSFTKIRQDSTIKRLANTDTKGSSLLLVDFDSG